MKLGGIEKFSLIDYPGKISAVIFTQGCNFRCPFCHNPELVFPDKFGISLSEKAVFSFLESRRNQLEGIVITGGEPTLHQDLPDFMARIKSLGFSLKLDTNGSNPQMLDLLIKERLVDFIAMDIKAPLAKYTALCGIECDLMAIKECIELIISSGLKHQFRTTLVRPLLEYDDVALIMNLIEGSHNYLVQKFVNNGKLIDDSLLEQDQFTQAQFLELQSVIDKKIEQSSSRKDLPLFESPSEKIEYV